MRGREGLKRSVLRVLDFIFVLRPTIVVIMWVLFLTGAALGARASGGSLPLFPLPTGLLLGFGAMTAVLGGGCLLNQISDVETDRVNEKLFFLPRGIISMRAAWVELTVLWLLAAALATPLSPGFKTILAASLLLNITYSAPPIRAKSHCPWDVVWNGVGFGFVATAAGWACVAPLTQAVGPLGLTYALAIAGVSASTTVLDVEGDRALGLRTTAAVLGASGASALAVVLVAAAGVMGAVLSDPLGFFGPLLSLPLLVRAHVTRDRAHRTVANQVTVGAVAVVASIRAPYLLPLLAIVYFGSRSYYRARFGFSYPGAGTP